MWERWGENQGMLLHGWQGNRTFQNQSCKEVKIEEKEGRAS